MFLIDRAGGFIQDWSVNGHLPLKSFLILLLIAFIFSKAWQIGVQCGSRCYGCIIALCSDPSFVSNSVSLPVRQVIVSLCS